MFQLIGLQTALAALEAEVDGLNIFVDLTGGFEATTQGTMPTAHYSVEMDGREFTSNFPLPVLALPATLGETIRTALGEPVAPEVEALIRAVETCPVT